VRAIGDRVVSLAEEVEAELDVDPNIGCAEEEADEQEPTRSIPSRGKVNKRRGHPAPAGGAGRSPCPAFIPADEEREMEKA
jgi:hypothetical protein